MDGYWKRRVLGDEVPKSGHQRTRLPPSRPATGLVLANRAGQLSLVPGSPGRAPLLTTLGLQGDNTNWFGRLSLGDLLEISRTD